MPAGQPLQASIDVLIDGDIVRSFDGIITDDLIASVLFVNDWPTSTRIGAKAGGVLTGKVVLSEPLAILIPGREYIDIGDAIRFELSPVAPPRGDGGEDGILEASLLGRDLEQIIVHDIRETVDIQYCDGDGDLNGVVDLGDLLAVIGNWGTSGPVGDVDGSGAVDLGDLLMVIGNWGCTATF